MKHHFAFLLMIFLVSCGSGQPAGPSVTPRRSIHQTAIPSPTPTTRRWASPTQMSHSTAAPNKSTPTAEEATPSAATPELLPTPDPVYISPLSINLNNLSSIAEIARLGRGKIKDFDWSPSGNMIAVANARGVDFYFTNDLQKPSLLGFQAEEVVFLPDGERMAMIVGSEIYLVMRSSGVVGQKMILESVSNREQLFLSNLYISPGGTTLLVSGEGYIQQEYYSVPFLAAFDTSTGRQLYLNVYSRIADLFFSPDGSRFVTLGEPGMCVATTGYGRNDYCQEGYFPVAFTTDGRQLIARDRREDALLLLDVKTGEKINTLGKEKYFTASRSGDGKWAVLWSDTYQVWDLEKAEKTALTGDAKNYSRLLLSPDGAIMMAYNQDGESIDLINLGEGRITETLEYQPEAIQLLFPDGPGSETPGNLLWVQYKNGDILRWNIADRQFTSILQYTNWNYSRAYSPNRLRLSPNGRWIAVAEYDTSEIGIYRQDTLEKAYSVKTGWSEISFSPDGQFLTILHGAKLSYVNLQTGETQSEDLKNRYQGFRYSDPLTLLAWRNGSQHARKELWDITRMALRASIEVDLDFPVLVDAKISPDGRYFVVADNQGLQVYDSRSSEKVIPIRKPSVTPTYGKNIFGDGGGPLPTFDGFAIHPFVSLIATREAGGPVRLWNADTGKMLTSLTPDCRIITDIAFGADGRYLAGGCEDGTVFIWGVRD